MDSSMILDILA